MWSEDHRLQNYLINKNLGARSNKAHFKINFQVILLNVKVGVVSYSWLRNKHLASLLGHFVPSQEHRCYYWLLNWELWLNETYSTAMLYLFCFFGKSPSLSISVHNILEKIHPLFFASQRIATWARTKVIVLWGMK